MTSFSKKVVTILTIGLFCFSIAGYWTYPSSYAQSIRTYVAPNFDAAVLVPALALNSSVIQATVTFYNGTQIILGNVHPDGDLYSRPYEGGWQTGSHSTWGTTTSVQAEISFPNTNPSSIPSGNWLEGTINLQGEDSKTSGLDYLIRAAHVLYPNGVHGLVADMWKDCEGIPFDGCGGASANEITAFILDISGLSASQPIYVRMTVYGNALYWLYSYDGLNWYQYYYYTPPSSFLLDFYLGTVNIVSPPYFTAYYFQFGFWTQSWWRCFQCFYVQIQNPSYYKSGSYTAVSTAESMDGPYTFFDQTWTLSNSAFPLAEAVVPQQNPVVTFWEAKANVLANNIVLWP
ncbi:MAG: hypothetical protein ACRECH_11115 [Nitrososphaerales archaeon]